MSTMPFGIHPSKEEGGKELYYTSAMLITGIVRKSSISVKFAYCYALAFLNLGNLEVVITFLRCRKRERREVKKEGTHSMLECLQTHTHWMDPPPAHLQLFVRRKDRDPQCRKFDRFSFERGKNSACCCLCFAFGRWHGSQQLQPMPIRRRGTAQYFRIDPAQETRLLAF